MAEPLLKRGASGTAVRQLQAALKEAGHDPGPIDGHFGPATEAAVRAFQQEKGIAVDGVVGDITWLNIDEDAVFSHPVLRRGATGNAVRRVQKRLTLAGYDTGRRRWDLRLGDGGRRQGAAAGVRPRRRRDRRAADVERDRLAGGLSDEQRTHDPQRLDRQRRPPPAADPRDDQVARLDEIDGVFGAKTEGAVKDFQSGTA